MKKILPFLILLFTLFSCSSSEKKESQKAKHMTEKLLETVFKNENISGLSAEEFIHVKFEKIDNANSLATIMINSLDSEKASYTSSFNGTTVFIYQSIGLYNQKEGLDYSAFFVPDCPSHEFLVISDDHEILNLKKLSFYPFENSNQKEVEIKFE